MCAIIIYNFFFKDFFLRKNCKNNISRFFFLYKINNRTCTVWNGSDPDPNFRIRIQIKTLLTMMRLAANLRFMLLINPIRSVQHHNTNLHGRSWLPVPCCAYASCCASPGQRAPPAAPARRPRCWGRGGGGHRWSCWRRGRGGGSPQKSTPGPTWIV